jgi:NAD(P)-dependent dehydrogenase (short-subunit alcohol dehydrogenase family)
MKIFLTGATGYLGSAIARELTAAGHNVAGLARSANSTRKLQAARIVPHSGSLADAGSLATAPAAPMQLSMPLWMTPPKHPTKLTLRRPAHSYGRWRAPARPSCIPAA